jgi:exopolysaccharide biosynthesis protein
MTGKRNKNSLNIRVMKRIIISLTVLLTFSNIFAQETAYNLKKDSLAFVNANWQITDLKRGAQAKYAQIPMFHSTQSICVIKYPARRFKSEILDRPGERAGKPSVIGKETGAALVMNAGYFNVKKLIPSVYFRVGDKILGYTYPSEVYRVDGVVGFKDKKGRKMEIAFSDTTSYEKVAGKWHSVMASGPMLILDEKIVVPVLKGDMPYGDNVDAMKEEMKNGSKIRTHYSSAQFYDKRHPRAAIGKDDEGNIYYVVIDGRFNGQAEGATIYETAYICHLLGMTDAINLDGGGSTTLWSEETGVINHPYDNRKFDHDGERTVPNLIVAY